MQARELFKYIVTLAGTDGSTGEEEFSCYWSPEKENTLEEVASAAAALKTCSGKRDSNGNFLIKYEGLTARLAA